MSKISPAIKAILVILSTTAIADSKCVQMGPLYSIAARLPAGLVVTGSYSYLSTQETSFTDTLYNADLLSRLLTAYKASDVVVIASAVKVTTFTPAFTGKTGTVCASESVTVRMESVLKGEVKSVWNFVYPLVAPTHQYTFDSSTGLYTVIVMSMSHTPPSYASIRNERFLLFLKSSELPTNETFMLPFGNTPCDPYTNAFKCDSDNAIFYDGIDIDSTTKKVRTIPELKIPAAQFTEAIGNINTVVKLPRLTHQHAVGMMQGTMYDLQGKQLPKNRVHYPKGCAVYMPIGPASSARMVLRGFGD